MKNLRPQITLTCLCATVALAATAFAVDPPPDGGYPNQNTAEGDFALFNLTTGSSNTALGFNALFSNTTGAGNTATGSLALQSNTTGGGNTAHGEGVLSSNTTGAVNTAIGEAALQRNTSGSTNTASGVATLFGNTTGSGNTATGSSALTSNSIGTNNTANGGFALVSNTTGSNNIAVGVSAGSKLVTGSNNIFIGNVGNATTENKDIRIGTAGLHKNAFIAGIFGVTVGSGAPVIVNSDGRLGTITSSARFKDAIQPMDEASEAIFSLKPVTFHYKKELDSESIPQFGLVAEQVENVDPDLVVRDDQGKPYTVRYEAVNAMLLNEFLKEHRKVETLAHALVQQQNETRIAAAEQQREIESLRSALKAQSALIQKVSDKVEATAPEPRVVANN